MLAAKWSLPQIRLGVEMDPSDVASVTDIFTEFPSKKSLLASKHLNQLLLLLLLFQRQQLQVLLQLSPHQQFQTWARAFPLRPHMSQVAQFPQFLRLVNTKNLSEFFKENFRCASNNRSFAISIYRWSSSDSKSDQPDPSHFGSYSFTWWTSNSLRCSCCATALFWIACCFSQRWFVIWLTFWTNSF